MTGPGTYLAIVLYTLPGFVLGSEIHELSHAAVALRFGDPTPRRDGRMTLDPRRNIDPLGCFALFVVNPVAAMSVGAASRVFEGVIVPGTTPLLLGLPNVFTILS